MRDEANPLVPLGTVITRGALLAALWMALAGGGLDTAWVGVPTVALATFVSVRVAPPAEGPRVSGLLVFVPWFLWQSARGALDVAVRALRPSLPIRPGVVGYRMRLDPQARAAVFFIAVIGLLPGTICARADGAELRVHVIDVDEPVVRFLEVLEARVAALFGVTA